MSNVLFRVKKPDTAIIEKFEKDKDIRALIDLIFSDKEVKKALDEFVETIVTHVKLLAEAKVLSKEDLEIAGSKEIWVLGFKQTLYTAWAKGAVRLLVKDETLSWNVKKALIKLLKTEVTPEAVIVALNSFNEDTMLVLMNVLLANSICNHLPDGLLSDLLGKFQLLKESKIGGHNMEKIIQIEKPNERVITKLESDDEIRQLLDSIFGEKEVKDALEGFSSRIVATIEFVLSGECFSFEDLETVRTKEFWQKKAKSEMFNALIETATDRYFPGYVSWDLRYAIKKLIKTEVTPESVVAAIELIEIDTIRMLRHQISINSLNDFVDEIIDELKETLNQTCNNEKIFLKKEADKGLGWQLPPLKHFYNKKITREYNIKNI